MRGDGRSTQSEERLTANSKPGKHRQFLVLVISVTVRVIICQCPCTTCERHLAFFFLGVVVEKRLILALWRGPGLHSHRVPPVGLRVVHVAAERTIPGEASLLRRPRLSPSAQCQIDAQSSDLSYIQKCSLEVTYGRMDSTQSERRWISQSRKW